MGDPVLHLLAGPDGAGKSTFFVEVLGPATGLPFINADLIASARWPGPEMQHAYEAAEVAAEERNTAVDRQQSFISEKLLSHPSKVDFIREAKSAGYEVTLHIVLIPEELAIARVHDRVAQGGHDVPEDKIRGRFARLWTHLRAAIDIADETIVCENSRAARPFRRIATFSRARTVGTPDWTAWTPDELRTAGRPK